MLRADPEGAWHERANWMIDAAEWVRYQPPSALRLPLSSSSSLSSSAPAGAAMRSSSSGNYASHARMALLLRWLDQHKAVRRTVQMTLQRTLREASGPELFSATGLPHEAAFFSELSERLAKATLPRHLSQSDLSALFTAMFPRASDAQWMLELDSELIARMWRLAADDGISHLYSRQIDEALEYLCAVVLAEGISPAFRQRLEPKLPLQSSPFMALRRELESYLRGAPDNLSALRSVRMLVAVCQAQTDRIYAHLDEHGVSVSLVYRLERMRAQLLRMLHLIDLRTAGEPDGRPRVQLLLADLIDAHHKRSSIAALVRRTFALLARKMVERNGAHGEHYIARDGQAYRLMLKAACRGGVVTAFTELFKGLLKGAGLPYFFQGVFASLNYAGSFLLISAIGGVLATKQPAVTAPALAARMSELDTVEGLRRLTGESAMLLRSQAAAIFGNVAAVVPAMLAIALLGGLLHGGPVLGTTAAQYNIGALSLIGMTPLYAAATGVLLWLSSLVAGFADNWFALRKLRDALAHQRQLVHALGAARAGRLAAWLDRHIATIAGNISLGVLLGMTPVLAQFFGLPLDVRHVTLASANLTMAAAAIGWPVLAQPAFWLAVAGIVCIGILNVSVAFGCALALALRAREVPRRIRRLVLRAVLRRFMAAPSTFLFPAAADRPPNSSVASPAKRDASESVSEPSKPDDD